ncbi:MAG TPA: thioredoxin family protein [Vicinamibacteria bacterium]|nr:thioredoxin family protein [Vicinamibacteria bacterium]
MKAMFDAPVRASAAGLDRILTSGNPTLVVFEQADCEPCRSLRPLLDELAREFRDRVLVVRVTDAGQGWLAARYHLLFVPTLLFYRDGCECARIAGNPGPVAIREHLEWVLNGEVPPNPAEGPRYTLSARFGPARDAPAASAGH